MGLDEIHLTNAAPIGRRLGIRICQAGLDGLGDCWECRGAVVRKELHAIVLRRVMTRGDHAAPGEIPVDDGPRDEGGGDVAFRQYNVMTVGTQDPSEFLGEPAGMLPGVVPDGERLVSLTVVLEIAGDRLTDPTHSWGGEHVEGGPPAVGAE
jgi:hypothetical protein